MTPSGALSPGTSGLASEAMLPVNKQPIEASRGRAQSFSEGIRLLTAMHRSSGKPAESLEAMTALHYLSQAQENLASLLEIGQGIT